MLQPRVDMGPRTCLTTSFPTHQSTLIWMDTLGPRTCLTTSFPTHQCIHPSIYICFNYIKRVKTHSLTSMRKDVKTHSLTSMRKDGSLN